MKNFAALGALTVSLLAGGPASALEWPVVYIDTSKATTSGTATKTINKAASAELAIEQAAAEPIAPPPPPVTLKIAIDLTSQSMTVTENGATKYTWKISSGRAGYITPTGDYKPQWMARHWRSRKYGNAPMPHSVFFHRGYAIHATYATGRLGRPASHGCIRLSPRNAKTLYRMVSRHGKASTSIKIRGKTKIYRQHYAKKRRYRPVRRYRQVPPGYQYSYRRPPPGAYGTRARRYRQVYRAY